MILDDFFMAEWRARRPGERRSLRRARDLAELLGLDQQTRPVLSVVGSKGKGTAATYASACLADAGNRVVTVTSPGYRNARERIRVDGRAISAAKLSRLAAQLYEAVRNLPGGASAYGGYLAPAGLFTIAGVLHARRVGADVIVLEAGMGGRSDEISLFPATVAAITPIFAEHVGKLGDTPAQIAREKAAIVTARTRAALTVQQQAGVMRAIVETVRERLASEAQVDVVTAGSTAIPRHLLPPGLGAVNAELGCAAASRLFAAIGQPPPGAARHGRQVIHRIAFSAAERLDSVPRSAVGQRPQGWVGQVGERLAATLGSVRLPGRLSRHRLPGSATELIVDSATTGIGIAVARTVACEWLTRVDHVLACLPDHKDVAGAITELAGLPVTFVRLPGGHLRFTHPLPAHWHVIDAADMTRELVAGLGRRVLAIGPVYFAGRVLDLVDADTERLFTPARDDHAAWVRTAAPAARPRYGQSRPARRQDGPGSQPPRPQAPSR